MITYKIEAKMKKYIKIVLVLLCIATIAPVNAQISKSAYFLEGMPMRGKLNPALSSEYGYVSFPFLGDINVGVSSNVGAGTFLYPSGDGELLNFLSPDVNSKEFLGSLKSQNKMVTNLDLSILSFGFHKWNGFNTFDVSLHAAAGVQMPKDIFEFLKVGRQSVTDPTTYQIRDINMNAIGYVDIALGHSHKINDKWNVGVKLKGLVGIANADINIDKMDITMDNITSQWIIESKGTGNVALKGLMIEEEQVTPSNGENYSKVDGVDFDDSQIGVAGGGIAVDLGVTYRPIKELEISASVNDLGFIYWKHNKAVETISTGVVYDGINTGNDEDFDVIDDEFSKMIEFREVEKPKTTSMLKASLNVGAEYSFLNNAISLGVLSHTRFGKQTYAEGMFSVNFRAKKIFMMSLNGTVSNMGSSFGTLLNLCPKGFNLFVAVDCFPALKVTPDYYLPINKFHVNASMGLSFTFGKRVQHKDI